MQAPTWGYTVNRNAAKAKVRNHLKSKGKHWCYISEDMMNFWWHILNNAIFGGVLRKPARFETTNFHNGVLGTCKPFGRCKAGGVVIALRREYDERMTFLTVLAHEMVHQYQWQEDNRMTHGKTFYDWGWRVKIATGLPLNEYVDA